MSAFNSDTHLGPVPAALTLMAAVAGVAVSSGPLARTPDEVGRATEARTIEALRRDDLLGVAVRFDGDMMTVTSDGLPNHEIGQFPMRRDGNRDGRPDNPNRVALQDYSFAIPRIPVVAERPGRLPMGPIGVSISGAAFYNAYTAEGLDAVETEVFDACNGHSDPARGYRYHATAGFPYLLGCYRGQVASLPRFDDARCRPPRGGGFGARPARPPGPRRAPPFGLPPFDG